MEGFSQAFFLKATGVCSATGNEAHLGWKALLRQSGTAQWGLRGLVLDMRIGNPGPLKLCKLVGKELGKWKEYFAAASLNLEAQYRPSRRSHDSSLPDTGFPDDEIHMEATITTGGFLALLTSWHHLKLRKIEKQRASDLPTTFLSKAVSPEHLDSLCVMPVCEMAALCQDGGHSNQMCCHALALHRRLSLPSQCGCTASDAHRLLCMLWPLRDTRPAASFWYFELVSSLALAIDAGVDADLGHYSKDALTHGLPTRAPKRMRLGESLRSAASTQVIQEPRATASQAWARATGTLAPTTASACDDRHLAGYLPARRNAFQHSTVHTLACDGTGLGQPKEETIMYCLAAADKGLGGWCVPQALVT